MAKLTRKNQKVFGGNSSNIGQFGSAQSGTNTLTTDVETIQALAAYLNGWDDAIISGERLPTLEEFNGLNHVNTYQLAYILQEGIPEWNIDTTYYQNSIVKKSGTSQLWESLVDDNTGNSLVEGANWTKIFDLEESNTNAFVIPTDATESEIQTYLNTYDSIEFPNITYTLTGKLDIPAATQIHFNNTTFDGHFDGFLLKLLNAGNQYLSGKLTLTDSDGSVIDESTTLTKGIDFGANGQAIHNADLSNLYVRCDKLKKAIEINSNSYSNYLGYFRIFRCGNNTEYAFDLPDSAACNDIHIKRLDILSTSTGVDTSDWTGKGGYVGDSYGITIDHLHVEHICNEDGFIWAANGGCINGGYCEEHNSTDNAWNHIKFNSECVCNGVLFNCEVDNADDVVFNACRFLDNNAIDIKGTLNNCQIAARRVGIVPTDFDEFITMRDGAIINIPFRDTDFNGNLPLGNFTEYSADTYTSEGSLGETWYADSNIAQVDITTDTVMGQANTNVLKVTLNSTINATCAIFWRWDTFFNIGDENKFAWALLRVPAEAETSITDQDLLQVSFGLADYDFGGDNGKLLPIDSTDSGDNYYLALVKANPDSAYITFNINKVGGGNPPANTVFYIHSFGIASGGTDYSNMAKRR